jgi:hypothetical protein
MSEDTGTAAAAAAGLTYRSSRKERTHETIALLRKVKVTSKYLLAQQK